MIRLSHIIIALFIVYVGYRIKKVVNRYRDRRIEDYAENDIDRASWERFQMNNEFMAAMKAMLHEANIHSNSKR